MKTLPVLATLISLQASLALAAAGSPGPGVPNPADVLCEKVGGRLEILSSDAGESGYCVFGERATIGSWTLFRELKSGRTQAVEAFFRGPVPGGAHPHGIGLPNPASVNCLKAGGKLTIAKSPEGEIGICEFPDRSEIEEWTLFRGPDSPENVALARVLR